MAGDTITAVSNIGELITALADCLEDDWPRFNDPEVLVSESGSEAHFTIRKDPFSYRGYYNELAFSLAEAEHAVRGREFARVLRGVVGETFTGYKGGSYVMSVDTPVWIADYGAEGTRVVGLRTIEDERGRVRTIILLTEPDN